MEREEDGGVETLPMVASGTSDRLVFAFFFIDTRMRDYCVHVTSSVYRGPLNYKVAMH